MVIREGKSAAPISADDQVVRPLISPSLFRHCQWLVRLDWPRLARSITPRYPTDVSGRRQAAEKRAGTDIMMNDMGALLLKAVRSQAK